MTKLRETIFCEEKLITNFCRTKVYLGSDLWVRVSETHSLTEVFEIYTSYTSYTSFPAGALSAPAGPIGTKGPEGTFRPFENREEKDK